MMPSTPITVRDATLADIDAIRGVAEAAWRDTYIGLLSARTIEDFLEAAYNPEMLERRITRQTMLIADAGRQLVAFANAVVRADELELVAIYTLPVARGQGAGTALLTELRQRIPGLPVVASVVSGNRKGEIFYERRGFVSGEPVLDELFGEPVVERVWRLGPGTGSLSDRLLDIGGDTAVRLDERTRSVDHGDLLYGPDGLPR